MAEIVVMGAGVAGLACAWELARRGASVAVLDAVGPGAGASGGVVGALAPHSPEDWSDAKAQQLAALAQAPAFWAGVAQAGGGDPGYGRTGRVLPLRDAAAVERAAARVAAARAHWGDAGMMAVRRAGDVPGVRLACDWVLHDTLTARLAPRRAVAALVAALGGWGVRVALGSVPPPARAVIWATGAAALVDAGLGGGEKGQAALLDFAAPGAPVITAPGLYIVPHADGTVAVGSTSERGATDPGPDAHLEALLARACALCPDLAQARVLVRWAGFRPRAATRQPVVGPWPRRPGHWLLTGGYKTGFALAPTMAVLLADAVEGRDAIPADWRP